MKILYNKNLSLRAKAIYLYCFQNNNCEFQFKIEEARNHFKEGRDAILNAVKELEECGFIKKEQTREGQLFGHNVFVRLK